jgi:Plasmid pRiA4b ORF-3-like protein
MGMVDTASFKRLILRAVLRRVSPMVIRLVSIPDDLEPPQFHEVMRAILGWQGDLGYIIRIHGQEFNSFRRKTRRKALHEFNLHRQEKFLYICDTLHLWEWDIRILDIQEGTEEDHESLCLGGRGAAPPEGCGGPTGYRLMLKRQRSDATLCDPSWREAGIQLLAPACPEESAETWDVLQSALAQGLQSIDRRLEESGSLQPERFHLVEINERLAELQRRRFWS